MTTGDRSIELTIYQEASEDRPDRTHDVWISWSEHNGFTATDGADRIVYTSWTWDNLMRGILNKEVKLA